MQAVTFNFLICLKSSGTDKPHFIAGVLFMSEKFCNTRGQEITFTDDGIIFAMPSLSSEELIPYGRIKDIKVTKELMEEKRDELLGIIRK